MTGGQIARALAAADELHQACKRFIDMRSTSAGGDISKSIVRKERERAYSRLCNAVDRFERALGHAPPPQP